MQSKIDEMKLKIHKLNDNEISHDIKFHIASITTLYGQVDTDKISGICIQDNSHHSNYMVQFSLDTYDNFPELNSKSGITCSNCYRYYLSKDEFTFDQAKQFLVNEINRLRKITEIINDNDTRD